MSAYIGALRKEAAMDAVSPMMGTLLAAAVQLSGLPAVPASELPPILLLPRGELNRTVCPSAPVRCAGLTAAFDTRRYRIVMDDRLNLDDAYDASFLVHEMVHVLQFRNAGSTAFTSCEAVFESERQAYAVQNAYLREHDQRANEGAMLKFSRCPMQQADE
jgi:hypothetical protein